MTDMVSQRVDSSYVTTLQIPVRAVLNNKTFTAFSGFQYKDHRISFDIKKTRLFESEKHKNCFVLFESKEHHAEFCDFGMKSSARFFAEWDYDYNLFKYQCYVQRDTVNLTQDLENMNDTVIIINNQK